MFVLMSVREVLLPNVQVHLRRLSGVLDLRRLRGVLDLRRLRGVLDLRRLSGVLDLRRLSGVFYGSAGHQLGVPDLCRRGLGFRTVWDRLRR